jgi:hypothetical protein
MTLRVPARVSSTTMLRRPSGDMVRVRVIGLDLGVCGSHERECCHNHDQHYNDPFQL